MPVIVPNNVQGLITNADRSDALLSASSAAQLLQSDASVAVEAPYNIASRAFTPGAIWNTIEIVTQHFPGGRVPLWVAVNAAWNEGADDLTTGPTIRMYGRLPAWDGPRAKLEDTAGFPTTDPMADWRPLRPRVGSNFAVALPNTASMVTSDMIDLAYRGDPVDFELRGCTAILCVVTDAAVTSNDAICQIECVLSS